MDDWLVTILLLLILVAIAAVVFFTSVFVMSCLPARWTFSIALEDLKTFPPDFIGPIVFILVLSVFWILVIPLLILGFKAYLVILLGHRVRDNSREWFTKLIGT